MPHIRVDADAYDEFMSEIDPSEFPGVEAPPRPSGGFEYEEAEGTFDPAKLGRAARVMFDALLAAGATEFRVRYDGGYDEGFAHADGARIGGRLRDAAEVTALLATPEVIEALRAASASSDGRSMWGNAAEVYGKAGGNKAVEYALEELAYELATRLLHEGFGTGEYQLYGEFSADLQTHLLADIQDVPKPPNME